MGTPFVVAQVWAMGIPNNPCILLSDDNRSLCFPPSRLFLGNSVRMSFSCIRMMVTASIGASAGMVQFVGKNSTVLLVRMACVNGM